MKGRRLVLSLAAALFLLGVSQPAHAEHGQADSNLNMTHLANEPTSMDASGNVKLHDILQLLERRITQDFAEHEMELNLKLLNPSYVIRSVPANAYDSVYCVRLAHAAVHAAMAGRTELVVGRWHGRFVHIPISVAISRRSTVDPDGDLWMSVLEATGQPARMGRDIPVPA